MTTVTPPNPPPGRRRTGAGLVVFGAVAPGLVYALARFATGG